ncbi:hypothetical protein C8Q77DRAFT_104523 [Trametes polyzona]|nr:hypothetical protein C8Q77DRAFT_104523 [Trametes polyzona]
MTTVYDKAFNSQVDKQRVVTQVVLTATDTVSTVPDEPSVYHWQFYFPLAPTPGSEHASKSVMIDMIPVNPPTGCMIIASKAESASPAESKIELPIAVVGSPTVEQIIDLFKKNGMDRYEFDATGSGCLWWVWTGLGHLEEAGIVESGATEELRQFHHEQYTAHPERHPMPLRKGRFY